MKVYTKKDLVDMGLRFITDGKDIKLFRTLVSGSEVEIKRSLVTCKHKYGHDKSYYAYSWYGGMKNGKQTSITLSACRIVYIICKGDIPQDYDVDHIDNNSLNNDPDNLQVLSRRDNLAKRFVDDPNTCWNQYMAQKRAQ